MENQQQSVDTTSMLNCCLEFDWESCCLCQLLIDQNINFHSVVQGTEEGYSRLSDVLPIFSSMGELDFDLNVLNDGSGIKQTLIKNKAKYHPQCYRKYNKTQLERKQKQFKKRKSVEKIPESTESPKKTRQSTKEQGRILRCVCCKGGATKNKPLHALAANSKYPINSKEDLKYVADTTAKWQEYGAVTGNENIISEIGTPGMPGFDVRSVGLFYHLQCSVELQNEYNRIMQERMNSETSIGSAHNHHLFEQFALRNVISYILEHFDKNPGTPLKIKDLEEKFKSQLAANNIEYSSHTSRFFAKLQSKIPELKSIKIWKNSFVTLSGQINEKLLTNLDTFDGFKVMNSLPTT